MAIEWEAKLKPKSEDIWCAIWTAGDYQFAYWVDGTGCWDCPDIGWIEDDEVDGWVELPDDPNEVKTE